jgi:NhaC family Na+:H+ antiporter
MPGRMYADAFKKLNLKSTALSRSLEDGGTITSVLVPWNTCAVYISGVLGISTFEYLPYCFFNILSPFMSVFIASIGYKIVRKSK